MIKLVSTRGGVAPVDFETAVLQGFANDGGLFVPESIPRISEEQLRAWSSLSFSDLAFEILSLYIDRSIMSADKLSELLADSFGRFSHPDVTPVVGLKSKPNRYILELSHGPTLSFKDMAMGFLVNAVDFFLTRKNDWVSLVLATTGDTGPAAAHAAAGKKSIECWPLYPEGMISDEQVRQMTTLEESNIHAVGVSNCPDGGDDLDLVIADMFADIELKRKLRLSSVNSINWCRVMAQSIHYFHAYFQVVDRVGEEVVFSVPAGAFGNLFGGFLAREMGLPVKSFIAANNRNTALHRVFTTGRFTKADLIPCASSAIDIVVPYNFWRYLYFASGRNSEKIRQWMTDFQQRGEARLDEQTLAEVRRGFVSASVEDDRTLAAMANLYRSEDAYLMDPHTAVAVVAAEELAGSFPEDTKIVCLSTAHPSKFPDVVRKALGELPEQATHESLENARKLCQRVRRCDLNHLAPALKRAMLTIAGRRSNSVGD